MSSTEGAAAGSRHWWALKQTGGTMGRTTQAFAVAAGICIVACYFWKRLVIAKAPPDLHDAVIIFIGAAGCVAGCRVCGLAFSKDLRAGLADERLVVFLGGFIVTWVSFVAIAATLKR